MNSKRTFRTLKRKGESFTASPDSDTLSGLEETSARMKERLKHLVDELDELIRKCANIIDSVELESQLVTASFSFPFRILIYHRRLETTILS